MGTIKWRSTLLLTYLLWINLGLAAQNLNIDSLKNLAQEAPFPERVTHLKNWYVETTESFHKPEIAMMKAGVDYLESLP